MGKVLQGWSIGAKRLILLLGACVLAPLLLLGVLYLGGGYVKTTGTWWYPFVTSFLSDYYVTGPFAMTSNTREDNPVWHELPGFNKYLARLTYAMSRGHPGPEVAWLMPHAEWPDRPALGEDGKLNAGESAMSRALVGAGVGYHRVSRSDLLGASFENGNLRVGEADFGALLVDEFVVAQPALLLRILQLRQAGLHVVWQGELPRRALGWRDHVARDARVASLSAQLAQSVAQVDSPEAAAAALLSAGHTPRLRPLPGTEPLKLRFNRRVLDGSEVVLVFNETTATIARHVELSGDWRAVHVLDPATGEAVSPPLAGNELAIEIPPGRTRLLLLEQAAEVEAGVGGSPESANAWDWSQWRDPPRKMHPMIRWWWPGNAVAHEELQRELLSLYEAGYGGVEIQTLTIGMSRAHLEENESSIYTVGTGSFFDHLKTVFRLAQDLDMTVDLTLGSGWSSGAPSIDEYPEQQLLRTQFDVDGPARLSRRLPPAQAPWYATPSNWIISNTIGDFDTDTRLLAVVAARVEQTDDGPVLADLTDISQALSEEILDWDVPNGSHRVFAFYQNATAHNVVASGYPGALHSSPIIDHLDPGGLAEYLEELGDPWLDALYPFAPRAVFVDSFELIGELPWATRFAERFGAMMGYDITPYLPLLFMARGESKYVNVVLPPVPAYRSADDSGQRVREDYETVRQQLFLESFVQPVARWAHARGLQLRLQAHGGYGDYLDSYKLADMPEAEGLFAGGSYDFLKLAASAAHVAGQRFVSSESFITMTTDFNALVLEDYYRLAGNAYAAGINVTVCHGYAYHYSPADPNP